MCLLFFFILGQEFHILHISPNFYALCKTSLSSDFAKIIVEKMDYQVWENARQFPSCLMSHQPNIRKKCNEFENKKLTYSTPLSTVNFLMKETSPAEFLIRKSNKVFIKMYSHRKGKFKVNFLYSLIRSFPHKQH